MKYAKMKDSEIYYFALNENPIEGLFHGISLMCHENNYTIGTCALRGSWFGTLYEATTKEEFDKVKTRIESEIKKVQL